MTEESIVRRPLQSRSTGWARFFSRSLLAAGLTPNAVSLASLGFAALSGAASLVAASGSVGPGWLFWLMAAAGIQLRLFCNLMDGMLAVEGGLKSVTGELFNEIPDRIADALILVPLGYAAGTAWGIGLGWAAAVGAVFTAYVRALGASLTGRQDFCGPMAKPHRMAAATLGCLLMMGSGWFPVSFPWLIICLAVINAGMVVTGWRRVRHLACYLEKQNLPS